jgi:hypothetical protein
MPEELAAGETECDEATYNSSVNALMNPPLTLAQQAKNALSAAGTYTWQAYGMFGKTPPADVVAYVSSLQSIASGADTTSTALPTVPTELTGGTTEAAS